MKTAGIPVILLVIEAKSKIEPVSQINVDVLHGSLVVTETGVLFWKLYGNYDVEKTVCGLHIFQYFNNLAST